MALTTRSPGQTPIDSAAINQLVNVLNGVDSSTAITAAGAWTFQKVIASSLGTGQTPFDVTVNGKHWQMGNNVGAGSGDDTFGLYSYTATKRMWEAGQTYLKLMPDGGGTTAVTVNGTDLVVDSTNHRVGVGRGPLVTFDVAGANMGGGMQLESTTGTNAAFGIYKNTGGRFFVGVDNSAGNAIGNTVYAGAIWHEGNQAIEIGTNNTYRGLVAADGGLEWGSPTGASKGANTANFAGDIYKNNSAYTNPDYAVEHWANGQIVLFADSPGAWDYPGLTPLADLEAYMRANLNLPRVAQARGSFERHDVLLEKVEESFIYHTQHYREIEDIKRRLTAAGIA